MKVAAEIVFNLLLVVLFSVLLYVSRDWPPETALFPRIVGFFALALSAVSLVLVLNSSRNELSPMAKDLPHSLTGFPVKAAIYFGWLAGFALLTWVLRFDIAVPVYMLLFLRLQAKLSWLKCVLFSLAVAAFVILVFGMIFKVFWPQGLLWELFGY